MKHIKEKNKINKKLIFGIIWLVVLLVMVFWKSFKREEKWKNLDYRIGVIANNGVALVSISSDRRMVNVLNLNDDVELWIPEDGSWQKNTVIKKFLENKQNLAKEMFWYDFGFSADKVLFLDSVDQWKNDSVLIKNWGLGNWIKYKWNYEKMFVKEEKLSGKLSENELFLDEILPRDFSESRLNNEDLRLSIFNNTNESGLANFMSKRLEWAGYSVVSAENDNQKINKCLMIYGKNTDQSYGWKLLNGVFDCEKKYNENLSENELEIYFGDKLATMIKYSNYSN